MQKSCALPQRIIFNNAAVVYNDLTLLLDNMDQRCTAGVTALPRKELGCQMRGRAMRGDTRYIYCTWYNTALGGYQQCREAPFLIRHHRREEDHMQS